MHPPTAGSQTLLRRADAPPPHRLVRSSPGSPEHPGPAPEILPTMQRELINVSSEYEVIDRRLGHGHAQREQCASNNKASAMSTDPNLRDTKPHSAILPAYNFDHTQSNSEDQYHSQERHRIMRQNTAVESGRNPSPNGIYRIYGPLRKRALRPFNSDSTETSHMLGPTTGHNSMFDKSPRSAVQNQRPITAVDGQQNEDKWKLDSLREEQILLGVHYHQSRNKDNAVYTAPLPIDASSETTISTLKKSQMHLIVASSSPTRSKELFHCHESPTPGEQTTYLPSLTSIVREENEHIPYNMKRLNRDELRQDATCHTSSSYKSSTHSMGKEIHNKFVGSRSQDLETQTSNTQNTRFKASNIMQHIKDEPVMSPQQVDSDLYFGFNL